MNPTQKHTPLNWYATGVHVQSARINEDNYVCEAEGTSHEQSEANAAFIVLAVNSHYALVEACEAYMREWNDMLKNEYKDSPLETVADKCRAALALVKGKE